MQLWDWAPELRAVCFAVRNTSGDPQRLTVRLSQCQRQQLWKDENEFHAPEHIDGNLNRMEWGTDNSLTAFHTLETADAVVPAGFDGWVEFRFPAPITMLPVNETSDDNRYNLLLDPCPGMEIGVDRHAYDFALRLWHVPGEERAHVAADCHAFRLDPTPRYGEAVNVIDGHSRRYATNPVHLWLSDFDQPLPQHLTLTFPHPATVARIHLTNDTLERSYFDTLINADQRYDPRCAASYRLELLTPTGWQEVATDTNNYQRHRMHTFPALTAQALRLTVLAVRDERYRARVYEIRVYGEEEQQ